MAILEDHLASVHECCCANVSTKEDLSAEELGYKSVEETPLSQSFSGVEEGLWGSTMV